MRVCFVHQNMPAQYRHLIAALLRRGDHVLAIGEHDAVQRWGLKHPNLGTLGYRLPDPATRQAVPPRLRLIDLQMSRAEAVLQALRQLLDRGLPPDLVVAHPGWGETLFLRGALPTTPFLGYCEFYYHAVGADVGFDPEYPVDDSHWQRLQLRNAPHLLALNDMDAGWCATEWQRAQFPTEYHHKLIVQHEGISVSARLSARLQVATMIDATIRLLS